MASLGELLKAIKLPPMYLLAISLISGVLLRAPKEFIAALTPFRPWIWVVFVAFSILFVVQLLWRLLSMAYMRITAMNALRSLSPDEKEALRPFILERTRTQYFELGDGVMNALERAGIVERSDVGNPVEYPYTIKAWAWKYLHQHKRLLDISEPSSFGSE